MENLPLQNRISQSSNRQISENTIEISYGDGFSQIARNGLNAQREQWSLRYNGLNQDDRDILISEWSRLGTVTEMDWQAPGNTTTKKYRFTGSYRETNPTGEYYNVTLAIREVFV